MNIETALNIVLCFGCNSRRVIRCAESIELVESVCEEDHLLI